MCSAPKPPTPLEPKKPQFLRNRYLDEYVGDAQAVKSLKAGRNSLRMPLGGPDTATLAPVTTVAPVGNTNPANVTSRRGGFRPIGGRNNGGVLTQIR